MNVKQQCLHTDSSNFLEVWNDDGPTCQDNFPTTDPSPDETNLTGCSLVERRDEDDDDSQHYYCNHQPG
jgi:hypothetical protein